ncbi:OX-2 membrane glycoprotein-like [Betta splendens]|uniref:OX-2 membrane glycoprotein-like n=1 Tax=Betta splendens TaxID=158456 RepID=A0A6P7L6L0_BETSP|nr:OX-2 membrane glycoprotein-like [Betta splendens]
MLLLIFITCLLSMGTLTASAAQIKNHGDVTAVYGGEAHYRCTMDQTAGAMQVTWQRLFRGGSIENLATYSERFNEQINEPYRDKVIFTEASLTSTSITVRNVTWEDESCYVCSFNVFPDGSTSKQTCLNVQGISRTYTSHVTNKRGGSEGSEVVFICSATGKPAPTIQWDLKAGATRLHEAPTTTVMNSDHTFTSSSNVTLQVPSDWDGHVDCLLNSGMLGERRERIPLTEMTDGVNKGARLSSSVAAPVVIVLVFVFSIVAAVILRHRRLKKSRKHADVEQEEGSDFQQVAVDSNE